jgi:hypothetical protein
MAEFLPRRSKGRDLSLGTIVDTRGDEGPQEAMLNPVVPPGIAGDVLAGPLNDPQGPCSVLVLVAVQGARFNAHTLRARMRKLAVNWTRFPFTEYG